MPEKYGVKTGEIKVAKAPDKLVALGIGSCIAVTMYDPENKVGGLAHVMLPESRGNVNRPGKYADTAIKEIISELENNNGKKNLEAKIVGGASMFTHTSESSINTGERNVQAVQRELEKEDVELVGEDVGGSIGRSVEFSTRTGSLTVKKKI